MPNDEQDKAGVLAPPPLIYLGVLLFGLLLGRRFPMRFLPRTMARGLGWPLLGGGVLLLGYDPGLDLVAVGPEGILGSYCICWLDQRSRTGLFEPVGTSPSYRRQGLGQAVIAEGLRKLRDRGAESAFVLCVHGSDAALGLYESAGFRTVEREYTFGRELAGFR